jgi:magnesium chelatase family protein
MHANGNDNRLICPEACGGEAAWAGGLDVLAPRNLLQLINHIKGTQVLSPPVAKLGDEQLRLGPDLSAVKGQESAKRALEITAAGGHNLLMIGPPGSGKSMLASCLPGILPPLSAREALEVSMIHSLAGTLPGGGLLKHRPFRDPHHSASLPALIGGGQRVKPGEISLAHHGVLFLDELPEFARGTLEALRQPLETGEALVARVNQHVRFPARFQLIAAMNPCRCGHLGDEGLECTKAPRCGTDYQSKISGPLMDRIDVQVDVPAVKVADLNNEQAGESSAVVAARVAQAREIQAERYKDFADVNPLMLNARADGKLLEETAPLAADAKDLLNRAMEASRFSARAYYRLLRVARTVADLEGCRSGVVSPEIRKNHMGEALSCRRVALG